MPNAHEQLISAQLAVASKVGEIEPALRYFARLAPSKLDARAAAGDYPADIAELLETLDAWKAATNAFLAGEVSDA